MTVSTITKKYYYNNKRQQSTTRRHVIHGVVIPAFNRSRKMKDRNDMNTNSKTNTIHTKEELNTRYDITIITYKKQYYLYFIL